jgi:predicted glycosyltransferase
MDKPVLLYYCQQTDGMCGLIRAFTIGNRLTDRFRVVIVNGGLLPPGTGVPGTIELVQLPPLRTDVDSNVFSVDQPAAMQSEIALRREIILEKNEQLKPRVILMETFPFGSRNPGDELTPLIERVVHRTITKPLIICSVLDILPDSRRDNAGRDDRTTALLNKHFDTVIVHSDPLFSRLEEYYQPRNVLTTPVYHSGFVVRDRNPLPRSDQREKRILVSAGDGIVGGALFRAAAEAHRLIWGIDQLPMTIIAGPCLPEQEWENLEKIARDLPGLDLKRSVPDLGAEMAKVSWAVSHCGYNAAVDVIATGVYALLVPQENNHGSDQADRLQRMSHWRAARTLMPRHLNGASLANSIYQLIKFKPAATDFNLDGAEITANIIYELAQSADGGTVGLSAKDLPGRPRIH